MKECTRSAGPHSPSKHHTATCTASGSQQMKLQQCASNNVPQKRNLRGGHPWAETTKVRKGWMVPWFLVVRESAEGQTLSICCSRKRKTSWRKSQIDSIFLEFFSYSSHLGWPTWLNYWITQKKYWVLIMKLVIYIFSKHQYILQFRKQQQQVCLKSSMQLQCNL